MPEGLRRDLAELVARYRLHPEFKDVYVEGERDQGLIQWFLEEQGIPSVVVYPITSVEISHTLVTSYGLECPSRRSDVLVLGMELEKQLGPGLSVACIADADYDHTLGKTYDTRAVCFTDYTSMEMYAFDAETVRKLIRIVSPGMRKSGVELLGELCPLLHSLYSMRVANLELGFGLQWVSFERCTTIVGSAIRFDEDELIRRYLNTRGRIRDFEAFKKRVNDLRYAGRVDPRVCIRGHDFIECLTWYLRRMPACRHLTPDSVRQALFQGLTADELKKYPMFQAISHRLVTS